MKLYLAQHEQQARVIGLHRQGYSRHKISEIMSAELGWNVTPDQVTGTLIVMGEELT